MSAPPRGLGLSAPRCGGGGATQAAPTTAAPEAPPKHTCRALETPATQSHFTCAKGPGVAHAHTSTQVGLDLLDLLLHSVHVIPGLDGLDVTRGREHRLHSTTPRQHADFKGYLLSRVCPQDVYVMHPSLAQRLVAAVMQSRSSTVAACLEIML